ncbi:MAG: 3-deoxy-D-manno-octulosonic acid transferase [Candidatus Gastranaerophilaceae bacterium]
MIYGIISTTFFLIILPFWYLASCFNHKLGYHFKEKMCIGLGKPLDKKSIVFYGVSVGEIIALQKLITKTKQTFPNHNIVVTTGTKTGQETAKNKLGTVADYITYFPFDFPIFINRFIKKVNPEVVIVAETELWPNIGYVLNKKNIPLYIVNGRMSDSTYGSYKKLLFFFAPILKNYTKILTQSQSDNDKLISIGANKDTTEVMGNLKFDIDVNIENFVPIEKNPCDQIIIAGSTHAGEDEIVLSAFQKIKTPNTKLLIASRHPERNENIFELCCKYGFKTGLRSKNNNFKEFDIIILDTMGELGKMYSICDFAFIGGSFNKTGGHNPLEACIFSKPVISGPSIHNFKDIYAIITRTQAGKIVNTEEELIVQMQKLLNDTQYYNQACEDCKTIFEQNRGAMKFVLDELQTLINM